MKLQLHGKNLAISEEVSDYIERKIGRLDRFLPDLTDARIEVRRERRQGRKPSHTVQATLRANGTILRAEERTDTVYAAIDLVADKIHRQIVRYKGKRADRWHGHAHYRPEPFPLDEEALTAIAEEPEPQVVRYKHFLVNSMTEDEAIEQMLLLNHDFFIFFNAELGRINVLYSRADGDYGLLDPEVA